MKYCDIKVDLISTMIDMFRHSDSCSVSGEACMHGIKPGNSAMGTDSKWTCQFCPYHNL